MTHFLTTNQLRQISDTTTDPIVKAMAEATLTVSELHQSLEKSLIEAIGESEDSE